MNNDDEIAASKRMHVGRYQGDFFFFLSQLWLLKRETYKVPVFVRRGQNVLPIGS